MHASLMFQLSWTITMSSGLLISEFIFACKYTVTCAHTLSVTHIHTHTHTNTRTYTHRFLFVVAPTLRALQSVARAHASQSTRALPTSTCSQSHIITITNHHSFTTRSGTHGNMNDDDDDDDTQNIAVAAYTPRYKKNDRQVWPFGTVRLVATTTRHKNTRDAAKTSYAWIGYHLRESIAGASNPDTHSLDADGVVVCGALSTICIFRDTPTHVFIDSNRPKEHCFSYKNLSTSL